MRSPFEVFDQNGTKAAFWRLHNLYQEACTGSLGLTYGRRLWCIPVNSTA